ncbi:MAG: hypothetical protein ACLUKN_12225 [Bacilli bacterium]
METTSALIDSTMKPARHRLLNVEIWRSHRQVPRTEGGKLVLSGVNW